MLSPCPLNHLRLWHVSTELAIRFDNVKSKQNFFAANVRAECKAKVHHALPSSPFRARSRRSSRSLDHNIVRSCPSMPSFIFVSLACNFPARYPIPYRCMHYPCTSLSDLQRQYAPYLALPIIRVII